MTDTPDDAAIRNLLESLTEPSNVLRPDTLTTRDLMDAHYRAQAELIRRGKEVEDPSDPDTDEVRQLRAEHLALFHEMKKRKLL